MKMRNLLIICGAAIALALSADSTFAQPNTGGGGNNGGGNGGNGGGGGGRRFGGGGQFNPQQFQQRMMDRYRQDLNFTNDADWAAVQPLVQKVMDARMAAGSGRFGGFRRAGGGGNGGGNGGGGNNFGPANPERDALQKAVDDNAPAGQIKDLLAKYEAAQKSRQAKLTAAQNDLRAVLTPTQEAAATLSGLLD